MNLLGYVISRGEKMIITINERQHINNEYVCSFCGDEKQPVIGKAYRQSKYDYPNKHYLFSYCAKCALIQADKIVRLVHPKHKVI